MEPVKQEANAKSGSAVSDGEDGVEVVVAPKTGRVAGKLDVLVQSVALFSDGYNIQVIGYMNTALECADSTPAMQRRRGMLMAVSTNAAVISGFVGSSIVSTAVIAAYVDMASDGIWRICFGIGAFLPLAILFFRLRLADSAYEVLLEATDGVLPGLVPVRCRRLPGRRQTYAFGWAVVCVFGFAIGGAMVQLRSVFPLFVTLYGLFQTFLSVGPGYCNFLVSSESFLRGHFLGFAAAIGKVGAAVGTTALSEALASFEDPVKGQQAVFLIGSGISVVGTLVVWFMIPNHPKTLEEEDARFRAFLEDSGYDTAHMGFKA
ncbi:hypothetical protein RB594_001194 [Gaeumannomyces avenae]